jgi:hypothetical protein
MWCNDVACDWEGRDDDVCVVVRGAAMGCVWLGGVQQCGTCDWEGATTRCMRPREGQRWGGHG